MAELFADLTDGERQQQQGRRNEQQSRPLGERMALEVIERLVHSARS